jgi:hypothetical protein
MMFAHLVEATIFAFLPLRTSCCLAKLFHVSDQDLPSFSPQATFQTQSRCSSCSG